MSFGMSCLFFLGFFQLGRYHERNPARIRAMVCDSVTWLRNWCRG
jgi:hypothetical protein